MITVTIKVAGVADGNDDGGDNDADGIMVTGD
jgi:hypothetical protein